MKIIRFVLFVLCCSCTVYAQEKIETSALTDPLLVKILTNSELKDLNELKTSFDKQLWIKIYKVPNTEPNNCFPESHGVCKYDYYLATSQLDDSPTTKAYALGTLGEITEYQWQDTDKLDSAIILIKANRYSKEALSYNKELTNDMASYQLQITATNLKMFRISKKQ